MLRRNGGKSGIVDRVTFAPMADLATASTLLQRAGIGHDFDWLDLDRRSQRPDSRQQLTYLTAGTGKIVEKDRVHGGVGLNSCEVGAERIGHRELVNPSQPGTIGRRSGKNLLGNMLSKTEDGSARRQAKFERECCFSCGRGAEYGYYQAHSHGQPLSIGPVVSGPQDRVLIITPPRPRRMCGMRETHIRAVEAVVASFDQGGRGWSGHPKNKPERPMTRVPDQHRYCVRCGSRLNSYNAETLCGSCAVGARDELREPPKVPPAFWRTDQMRDALATWHMGRVIFAYRNHPYHRHPLPQERVAEWLGVTQPQLSRLEKGPAPENLSKLRRWAERLGILPELLWFKLPGVVVATLEDVKRQDFLRAALGVTVTGAAAPLLELLNTIEPTPMPLRVGPTEIEQIRQTAREFNTWDHTYGGGLVREAVGAQLRYAVNLLNIQCPEKYRSELQSAVGFLGHTAAFMAFDAYAHADARSIFRLAWTCAEEAGDWHLRGKVLSSMARQAIWCGDADEGLTYIELAMVRSDRLTATERAMLHSARARALAKLRRVEEAARAVGQADEEFSHASPQNDPPWMGYYDAAQHSGDTGHALFDLALEGRFTTEARSRLQTAVEGHTEAYVRSKAISGIKLASLTMATGDPQEAATFGNAALLDAGHIRSRRAADDLRELAGFSERHSGTVEVEELRTRIDATVVGV